MSTNAKSTNDADCLNAEIGRRVVLVRREQGLTAEGLANLVGDAISVNTLRQLELGARRWNADNLEAVATALAVDARDLLPGPGEAAPGAPVPNPASSPAPGLSQAEAALVEAVRAGDARASIGALAALLAPPASAAGPRADPSPVQLALVGLAELVPFAPSANTDQAAPYRAGDTRRRLERLLR